MELPQTGPGIMTWRSGIVIIISPAKVGINPIGDNGIPICLRKSRNPLLFGV